MPFSTAAKNTMLDALTADRVRLHSGDPGAAGTANALGAGLVAATFAAASGGERPLSAAVDVTGLAGAQSVTWYSVWTNAGAVFLGSGQITTGDVAANAAGEYRLTTATKLDINDS
jgi:hypothetical protein